MRTIIATLALLLFALFATSQEKYKTWTSEYLKGEKYDIELSQGKKNTLTFWLDGIPRESYTKRAGLKLTGDKKVKDLIDYLEKAKVKYSEWKEIAIQNDVKDLSKRMEIKSPKIAAYWLDYKEYKFDYSVSLGSIFRINEDSEGIHYLLLIATNELVSSTNQFTKDDGAMLLFSSIKDIDDLIVSLDYNQAESFIKKPKTKDLFK